MLGSLHLTATEPTQLSTVRGMASWAGGGPEGKTCHDCKFRGYRRVQGGGLWGEKQDSFYYYYGCAKFFMLTGNHGPVIKPAYDFGFEGYPPACKYFVDKPVRTTKSEAAASVAELTPVSS